MRVQAAFPDDDDGPPSGGPQTPSARLGRAAESERQRFFLWAPVALGCGIAGYFALAAEPALWLALFPLIGALILKSVVTRGTLLSAFATALLLAASGFAVAKFRVEAMRAPVLDKNLRNAEVLGTVTRVEPRPPRGSRLTIAVEQLAGVPDSKRPRFVRVRTMSGAIAIAAGDRVRLTAALAPPAKPAIPGGFDFARSAWFESLGAVGYTFTKPVIEPRTAPVSFREACSRAIENLRQSIAAKIHASLPGETGSIAAALIMGERGGITTETNDAYRSSGLFHILSISGLHMVIMAGAVFFSVRLVLAGIPAIALRYPIKKWAAAAGILGALGYLAISGGAFATVRSALMIVVIFGAVLLDRPALALRNVALSAFVILAIFPESLFDAGFQMSFAAVTGLVATYEEVRRRMGRRSEPHPILRVLLFFGGIVFSTLIASVAVAPFAAYHFHQSQQYAVLANLVAIPICNLIVMPAALAALVLMPFGLEGLALWPMGKGIDAMTWCATLVAELPGAVGHLPAIPHVAFLLFVIGGLWLALWQSKLRLLGAGLVLAGIAVAPFLARPDVLIARNGELVALRGTDGKLSALPARQSKYELERWLEYDGDARKAAEVQRGAAFSCDGIGCVATVKGARLAVSRHPAAVADDCAAARIVVLAEPRPGNCTTGTDAAGGPGGAKDSIVIDFFDVWRAGTHALYVEPGDPTSPAAPRIRVDTVAAHRGDRPWAPLIAKREPRAARPGALARPRITSRRSGDGDARDRAGDGAPGEFRSPSDGAGERARDGASPSLPNFATRPEWLAPELPRAEIEDDDDFAAADALPPDQSAPDLAAPDIAPGEDQ